MIYPISNSNCFDNDEVVVVVVVVDNDVLVDIMLGLYLENLFIVRDIFSV